MALTTVDMQKMKSVSSELDKLYTNTQQQLKKMEETMGQLNQMWKGDAAAAYQTAYRNNAQNFQQMAQALQSCSQSLQTIANTYGKADVAAAEAIKSKMGGR